MFNSKHLIDTKISTAQYWIYVNGNAGSNYLLQNNLVTLSERTVDLNLTRIDFEAGVDSVNEFLSLCKERIAPIGGSVSDFRHEIEKKSGKLNVIFKINNNKCIDCEYDGQTNIVLLKKRNERIVSWQDFAHFVDTLSDIVSHLRKF